jgi:PAS domain S-box-containing protein
MMKDSSKTNQELIEENSFLKQRIQELEKSESDRKRDREFMPVPEEPYRLLVNNIPDIVYSLDGEGKIVTVNSSAFERYGYSEQDSKGKPFLDFIHSEDREIVIGSFLKAVEEQRKVTTGLQFRIVAENGISYWFELNSYAHFDSDGRYVGEDGVLRDITERKQAEEALRASNELFSLYMRHSPIFTFIKEVTPTQSFVLQASDNYREMIGTPGCEMVGKTMAELFPPEFAAKINADDWAVVSRGDVLRLDEELNGRSYTTIKFPILQGDKTLLAGYTIDITDRKRAEEALLQSEEKFSKAFQTSPYGITITRAADGKFIDVNDAFTAITGFTREEALAGSSIGMNLWVNEDDRQRVVAALQAGLAVVGQEFQFRTKSGEVITGLFSAQTIQLGHAPYILSSINDITERKRTEFKLMDALNEAQRFRETLDHVSSYIYMKDLQSRYVYANRTTLELFGCSSEELVGCDDTRFFPSNTARRLREVDSRVFLGEQTTEEIDAADAEGVRRVYLEVKSPIYSEPESKTIWGLMGISTDITERKQAEEQLRESLEQVRRAMQTTIQVLVMAVEIKDPYTAGHQRRMTNLARTMATEMGLSPEKIEGLRMAGVIHDIGKITLPTEILSKPTKLSNIELLLIKEHVQLGHDILKDVESPWPLAEIVYQHHERMDGSGYPRALKGEEILIEARILAVADVVEAMASHRPYRAALGLDAALAEIEKNKGTLYDPAAVDICLSLFREKGYQIAGT